MWSHESSLTFCERISHSQGVDPACGDVAGHRHFIMEFSAAMKHINITVMREVIYKKK